MLLALDTASRWMSLALFDGTHLLAEQTHQTDNQHTVQLTQAITGMLTAQNLAPQQLQALAISQGVGSYSGLRVGFGVAKGLALALQIPLIPVPTLEIVAAGTPRFDSTLIAVIQAGRKRILAQEFLWTKSGWRAYSLPINTTWKDLLMSIKTPCIVNGEIDEQGRLLLAAYDPLARALEVAWRTRRAGFLAQLAWTKYLDGDYTLDLAAVNPLYAKEP